MNILPKKRWHVRTKDNIARVRRDEAAAREEEEKRKKQLEYAESEARINFLRKQILESTQPKQVEQALTNSSSQLEHINLFSDFKSHIKTTNKESEKEKKEEQEKYEKQIGYLTYLGQNTNEALKLRSWYEIAPKRTEVGDPAAIEKDLKQKQSHDPLTLIKSLLPTEQKQVDNQSKLVASLAATPQPKSEEREPTKKKQKKEKKHKFKEKKKEKHGSKHKNKKKKKETENERRQNKRELLEKLRKERLHREATERARQEALFAPKIEATTEKEHKATAPTTSRIVQKYNSQFNPELAKQNML